MDFTKDFNAKTSEINVSTTPRAVLSVNLWRVTHHIVWQLNDRARCGCCSATWCSIACCCCSVLQEDVVLPVSITAYSDKTFDYVSGLCKSSAA